MGYLLLIIGLLCCAPLNADTLQDAAEAYRTAESATTLHEREAGFNKALALYASVDSPDTSGWLQYNIANTYYNLGEDAWALLHYLRAHNDLPRESEILCSLRKAQSRMKVPEEPDATVIRQVLYPHFRLSTGEKLAAFGFLSLFSLLAWSVYFWSTSGYARLTASCCFVLSLLFLGSAIIDRTLSPLVAVVVKPSPIYLDAGKHYGTVIPSPITLGHQGVVIRVVDEGRWLQVRTDEGIIGYLPSECVRVV